MGDAPRRNRDLEAVRAAAWAPLPTQLAATVPESGARALVRAHLLRAVEDAGCTRYAPDVRRWLLRTADHGPFSFAWSCAALGQDPDVVRPRFLAAVVEAADDPTTCTCRVCRLDPDARSRERAASVGRRARRRA